MVRNIQEQRIKKQSSDLAKKEKTTKKKESKGFYYSFFTFVLILCLGQIAYSAVLNLSKIVSYKAKIAQIEKSRNAALALNEQLKDNINNFSNVAGLEAIARNNLKMSSEDEVLVIINDRSKDESEKDKTKKVGFIKYN